MCVDSIVWNVPFVGKIKLRKNQTLVSYQLRITYILTFYVLCLAYDSSNQRQPVLVYARAFVYFMQNLDVHDLVSFE